MRNSRWKVPEIAFGHVADEALAVGIKAGDARVSVQHEGPFRSGVPVQFANASGGQSHVDAGNRFGNRKLPDRYFARPSAFLHAFVRDSERIFEGLDAAGIGGRRQERVGILSIERGIAGAGSAGAAIILGRVGLLIVTFLSLRVLLRSRGR